MPNDYRTGKPVKKQAKKGSSLGSFLGMLVLAALTVYVAVTVRADMKARTELPEETPAPVQTAAVTAAPEATPEPTPEPTPTPEPEYYTFSVVGDCTLAENKDKRGWGTAYQTVVGKDYAYPFKNTVEYFRDDYMTLANLECNLSDNKYDTIEWYGFLAPSDYANILTEGCVDFVTLANNHTADFGEKCYAETLASLDAVGMPYAGENETYIYQRDDGIRVGVYCLYNDKMKDIQNSKDKISAGYKKLKEEGAELFIAALHWGVEGAYSVSDTQREVGQFAVDTGFQIVYGSHPHRLEPAEQYGNGYIFYSMANWSFGGHTNPDDYDTAIIQFTVKKYGEEVTVESLKLIPCSISSRSHNHAGHSVGDNCLNDYCPTPYEEGSEDWDRVVSKLTGTYEGSDYIPNYQSILFG